MKSLSARDRWLLLASLAEGLLLGWGLETCFGIGRYRMIMVLGVAGGLGGVWVGRQVLDAWGAGAKVRLRTLLVGVAPAAAGFAIWFFWRVLPLIREEMTYSQ
ncbi:MAG: hypothetical protein AAB152_07125 [Candidatus Coatesbacteria bacterium]